MKSAIPTSFKCHSLMIVMSALLMLVGCAEDTKEDILSTAEFSVDFQSMSEGEAATVTVMLDKPASKRGVIRISLETNAIYGQDFVLDQEASNNTISVVFPEGEKAAKFHLTTFDDTNYDGSQFILFQLASASQSIMLGEISASTITIADDESPSVAAFRVASATLHEKAHDGIVVDIPFSQPAKGEGSVTVRMNVGEAVSGSNFTIDRKLENDSFLLNVVRNQTRVSFTVFPVDNELFTGNFILSFSIVETSGVVHEGANTTCGITIIDDEAPSVARFAVASGSTDESNANGIVAEIQLSSVVTGEGQITMTISGGEAVYGVDFITAPTAIDNMIIFNLTNGQNGASFTVFPVDNAVFKGDLTCSFSISEVSGVIWKGSTNQVYQLQIVDDEVP